MYSCTPFSFSHLIVDCKGTLLSACENGHTATAELLIANGADVEAKDEVRCGVYDLMI
jgi:hypothetical protein